MSRRSLDLGETRPLNAGRASARRRDQSVWCWGANNFGQVGDGSSAIVRLTPVRIEL